jgi:glutamate dehydrogenase (NAD(P)+)
MVNPVSESVSGVSHGTEWPGQGPAFAAMLEDFHAGARVLDLEPGVLAMLTRPKRQIIVSCPVRMDNGEVEVFTGFRVQYNITLGPAHGGIRFHPALSLDDVTTLAARMTWKCAVSQIPFGGGEGGVICDPTRLSARELEALTRRYIKEIVDAIGPDRDVTGPDLNTNEQVMAWVMDTYSMHVGASTPGVVTGKPLALGGSAGRRDATGLGLSVIAQEAARHAGLALNGARVAIQGFGHVGAAAARRLQERGARVVAIADQLGGVANASGLDIEAMFDYARQARTVDGFPGGEPLTNEQLFGIEADMLIPAAAESQITVQNARDIRARVVIEGANGPTTPDAHRLLNDRGVIVVPDILANVGGVTASYFEWVQDRHGYFWSEQEVNDRLEARMTASFETVLRTALRYRTDLRTAAYVVAIDRIATVTRMRGMYA